MKPILLQIPKSNKASFLVALDEGPYFYTPLHFHITCQLTLILDGKGTRFVGDNIERFEEGEIVFLGSNIPHVFRNDPAYYEPDSKLVARAIHAFFMPDFLGEKFWKLPELAPINKLLEQAERGIKVTGKTNLIVGEKLQRMLELEGFARMIELFNILQILAASSDLELLASSVVNQSLKKSDSSKINDVFNYVMHHFSEQIKLDDVAAVASMSPTAFCRYFKKNTKKTFSEFLNEIRIGHACKLITEEKYPIAEVAFLCGYKNISNFNRRFKTIMGVTPSEYQFRQAHDLDVDEVAPLRNLERWR